MEIFSKPQIPAPLLTLPRQSAGSDLSFLKPGELLSAIVNSSNGSSIDLKIDHRTLRVMSELQLTQGTKLNLKVDVKEGQVVLRIVTPPPTNSDSIHRALRQVLPKQQPLHTVFQQFARTTSQLKSGTPLSSTIDNATSTSPPTTSRVAVSALSINPNILALTSKHLLLPHGTTQLPTLPPKVEQAISTLFKQLPTQEKLSTAEGLKQAVINSGIFFESRLHQGTTSLALQSDLKTLLFRIASLLRHSLETLPSSPPRTPGATPSSNDPATQRRATPTAKQVTNSTRQIETASLLQLLGRQSEAALARLQMHQLTNLNVQQQGEEPTLTLELPIYNGKEPEVLELKILRDKSKNANTEEDCWSVRLKLDSERYGTVRAIVTLVGKQISTTFWCEQADTQRHFQQHLEELQGRMHEQGLEIGKTQAFTGTPPEPDNPTTPHSGEGLINIQA